LPKILFLNGDHSVPQDEIFLLSQYSDWNWIIHSGSVDINHLVRSLKNKEIHFIIANNIDALVLKRIKNHFILSPIIFYAPRLDSETLKFLYSSKIEHCVVGDGRQVLLIDLLKKLWAGHWKRFPRHLMPDHQSYFVKSVIRFIEEEPIKFFNINYMAHKLQFSEYQLRDLFKKSFNSNFRTFKQNVLVHYETILLFEKKLTPGQIYPMLNYRNLSAFSRSFRLRHGTSWQKVVRLQVET